MFFGNIEVVCLRTTNKLLKVMTFTGTLQKQEGHEALNCSPEYTGQKSNI